MSIGARVARCRPLIACASASPVMPVRRPRAGPALWATSTRVSPRLSCAAPPPTRALSTAPSSPMEARPRWWQDELHERDNLLSNPSSCSIPLFEYVSQQMPPSGLTRGRNIFSSTRNKKRGRRWPTMPTRCGPSCWRVRWPPP